MKIRRTAIHRYFYLLAAFTPAIAFAQRPLTAPPVGKQDSKKNMGWESTQAPSRMVFLNGVNIGNVRGQELQNVTLRIDDAGNINIVAPQYDVSRESSYHPLLPAELPRFPKSQAQFPVIPEGRYSKEFTNDATQSAVAKSAASDAPSIATSTSPNSMVDNKPQKQETTDFAPSAPLTQTLTPVGSKQSPSIPPITTPDLPADARGQNM